MIFRCIIGIPCRRCSCVPFVATVKELSYQLAGLIEETMRNYVSGTIAPHIIGTIGPIYAEECDERKGYQMGPKSGVELAMESYLKRTDGIREISQNTKGNVVSDNVSKEPVLETPLC